MSKDDKARRPKYPNTETLAQNIIKCLQIRSSSPEVSEYGRQRMRYMLAEEWEIKLLGEPQPPAPLTFSPDVERQNQLIMAFTHLCEGQSMLSQCEFYFRRYPFHGTPVSREDHARNMCEFYFGCFYIIKNRLKKTLNRLKAVCPHSKVHIGKTLRAFERAFEQEIRIRNSIQHHQPYGDVVIERISLARLLASGKSAHSKSWERQHLTAYRKFCRDWSRRARDNAEIVEALIDSVASVILREAEFLQCGEEPSSKPSVQPSN